MLGKVIRRGDNSGPHLNQRLSFHGTTLLQAVAHRITARTANARQDGPVREMGLTGKSPTEHLISFLMNSFHSDLTCYLLHFTFLSRSVFA